MGPIPEVASPIETACAIAFCISRLNFSRGEGPCLAWVYGQNPSWGYPPRQPMTLEEGKSYALQTQRLQPPGAHVWLVHDALPPQALGAGFGFPHPTLCAGRRRRGWQRPASRDATGAEASFRQGAGAVEGARPPLAIFEHCSSTYFEKHAQLRIYPVESRKHSRARDLGPPLAPRLTEFPCGHRLVMWSRRCGGRWCRGIRRRL
jgi:hypothetical protein